MYTDGPWCIPLTALLQGTTYTGKIDNYCVGIQQRFDILEYVLASRKIFYIQLTEMAANTNPNQTL